MALFPKMKIKAPKMAHHDLSHYFRTSMAPGTLVPIACFPVVPGDDIQLNYESLINTQALLSPLYGSYKLQIDTFFAGSSLYIPKLWRNGSMQQTDGTLDANYPFIQFTAPTEDGVPVKTLNPSSLFAYLGLPPWYGNKYLDHTDNINAIPWLMYIDIYRHYYVNRQAGYGVVINHQGQTATDSQYDTVNVADLDNLFLNLPVNGGYINRNLPLPLSSLFTNAKGQTLPSYSLPLSGLFLKCHMPDRMNVILNSDFFEKNVSSVRVSTTGDNFQIDQLVTAKKLWNSRNKDAMTSGTFKDWVRSHFGVTPKIMDDMPTFCGSYSSAINFEDIRATTTVKDANGEVEQALGDKGSSALSYGSSRMHRIVADRPGYVMVLASIVPYVDYFQFADRYAFYTKLSDEFRPEFNGIGLQDVLASDLVYSWRNPSTGTTAQINTYDESIDPLLISLGKQPAWIEYMTRVNKIRGTFCTTENSWVLSKNLLGQSDAFNPSTINPPYYVYPSEWNQPFAIQDATAQNFLAQFYIRHFVRSTVQKRLLPNF